jgi:hypothetical protein
MCGSELHCIEFYKTQMAPIVDTPSSEDPQLKIEEQSNRRKIRIQPKNTQQVNPRERIIIKPKNTQQGIQQKMLSNTVVFDPERGFD